MPLPLGWIHFLTDIIEISHTLGGDGGDSLTDINEITYTSKQCMGNWFSIPSAISVPVIILRASDTVAGTLTD